MKKHLTAVAFAVAAALSCLSAGYAADEVSPARMAIARELIVLSGLSNALSGENIAEMVTRQVKRSAPSIGDDAIAELQRIAREEFDAGGAALREDMAKVYAVRFSEAELQEMVDLYKTDTGKHLAAETPALGNESARIAGTINMKIMERFRAYMQNRAKKDQPAQ